ncbi:class Ib ribonucleoside-diphosphate reductase assembly flavoprotein NrdI [Corynebacterium heidelbergense]|nr:class Ib ribonucleoside-diphosphate reductase assembly flavoprotein NrdI [Corynebacterium heidelbergense]WCZ36047.1 Putative NrdI-like protein [Corynebacterium heidelbergense]
MSHEHTPLAYYWSSPSGNTKALADKLQCETRPIGEGATAPYILITPTYEQPRAGNTIPPQVARWLENNHSLLVGVIGTGNRNFGGLFCRAAVDVSTTYRVPVLHRCELRGTDADTRTIDAGIAQHFDTLTRLRGIT